jgi:hypothetical protein
VVREMSMHFETWVVAAAVLVEEGGYLHYTTVATRVMETRLATLGLRGRTPRQSVGTIMRKHIEVFRRPYVGYYDLCDREAARKHPDIAHALERMREVREAKRQRVADLEALTQECRALKERNAILEETVRVIEKTCRSVRRKGRT